MVQVLEPPVVGPQHAAADEIAVIVRYGFMLLSQYEALEQSERIGGEDDHVYRHGMRNAEGLGEIASAGIEPVGGQALRRRVPLGHAGALSTNVHHAALR